MRASWLSRLAAGVDRHSVAVVAADGGQRRRLDSIVSAGRGDSFVTRLVLAIPWPKEWAAGIAYWC